MILLYESSVLYYLFIFLPYPYLLYSPAERCEVSSVVLDGLVPSTFVLCFGAGRELDLVLEGIGLVVLDLALGREGNYVGIRNSSIHTVR